MTISAWEFEQQRDVARSLTMIGFGAYAAARRIGEAEWTGRTDNTGLGTRDLTPHDFDVWIDDWAAVD